MTEPFVDPRPEEYEQRVLAALEGARVYRMRAWNEALQIHRRCSSFHTEGWAFGREVGFTCSCNGREQEWRLPLTDLRSMLPEAREMFLDMRRAELGRAEIRHRREAQGADKRAKALLHRYLTKEQRTSLRATGGFEVRGQNGKTYRIEHGTCRNVFLMINGEKRVLYCIISAGARIPVYDLMLTQKVMLEGDIKAFFAKANMEILGPRADLRRIRRRQEYRLPEAQFSIPIAHEDACNPERWARERLADAIAQRNDDANDDRQATRGCNGRDVRDGCQRRQEALLEQEVVEGGRESEANVRRLPGQGLQGVPDEQERRSGGADGRVRSVGG